MSCKKELITVIPSTMISHKKILKHVLLKELIVPWNGRLTEAHVSQIYSTAIFKFTLIIFIPELTTGFLCVTLISFFPQDVLKLVY